MFRWFRDLLVPKGYFRLPGSSRMLPACDIRLLEDADFEVCEEIYRLNEAAHFPKGYFEAFSKWLRNRSSLILVAELDGAVLGLGGINLDERAGQRFAALSFGMVHPAHHRQAFGSTLLLSRLALIDSLASPITALLTTTGGSETFYRRFGFFYFQSVTADDGFESKHYVAKLAPDTQQLCLAALRQVRLAPALREAAIPSLDRTSEAARGDALAASESFASA